MSLLSLFLPTLFPSWRFFQDVGPSIRIDVRVLLAERASDWQEVIARPAGMSALTALRKVFWNAAWNEYLFLISLADRMIVDPMPELVDELNAILTRAHARPGERLQFRLRLIDRGAWRREDVVAYESAPVLAV
jgi:hypothetical protein